MFKSLRFFVAATLIMGECSQFVSVSAGTDMGKITMKEYYTGRAIDMKQAVAAANNIAIARLISTGEASPGSPGQAYYDNARIEIKETLRGEPFEQASISYTCQTIPESIAEKAPIKDSIYIFFLGIGKSHIRAIKIMPATDDYLQELKKLLEMK